MVIYAAVKLKCVGGMPPLCWQQVMGECPCCVVCVVRYGTCMACKLCWQLQQSIILMLVTSDSVLYAGEQCVRTRVVGYDVNDCDTSNMADMIGLCMPLELLSQRPKPGSLATHNP